MPGTDLLFIDADIADCFFLARSKSTLDCTGLYFVDLIPVKPKHLAGFFDTSGSHQQFDGEGLEYQGKSTILTGPRHGQCFGTMLRAADARYTAVKVGGNCIISR